MAEPAAPPAAMVAGTGGGVSYTSTPTAPSFVPPVQPPATAANPLSFCAVGLNEAALDSPSFRANAANFNDQIDSIERWLENHVKSTSRLVHEFSNFEETIHQHLTKLIPPAGVADGIIDADHTLLALKRVSEGSHDWWTQIMASVRRFNVISGEPIRAFLGSELRAFKESRRALEQTQKIYDTTVSRYAAQAKTKEPSALREDAFAVYEARRAYLKASMDYCQMAPQLRCSLDKLLTRVSADFWREMKRARDSAASSVKWGNEMERIRGWSKELEPSEASLRRELQVARRVISETTMAAIKPSRELDDYSSSTVPFLGTRGPQGVRQVGAPNETAQVSENQGWLFMRTVSGKPARVSWVRRWFYCRDGIFGYLVQGPHGVLQGDDIGVLLCSAKPAVQEERRFCFEVKTKSLNMMLQAETQTQLTEWLEVFEVAKKKAFEVSMSRDNSAFPPGTIDPAFAVMPPMVPDFSDRILDGPTIVEEGMPSFDRTGGLPVPGSGTEGGLMPRGSFDVGGGLVPPRRSITMLGQELRREDGESSREHAARIMQKLDLHRKATFSSAAAAAAADLTNNSSGSVASCGGLGAGGQAPGAGGNGTSSLGTSSQNLLSGYAAAGGSSVPPSPRYGPAGLSTEPYRGSLAPNTVVKSPVLTFLSKIAITASNERVLVRPSSSVGLPAGVLANVWGCNLWSHGMAANGNDPTQSPRAVEALIGTTHADSPLSPVSSHRKTLSEDATQTSDPKGHNQSAAELFPPRYPNELRHQHAQFRLLFPWVPLSEKLVLVFNAAWSSASEEGASNSNLLGNGRIYVTPDNMYFYSQTMGRVVTYAISLDTISEVTAAPGKDCDYIFLHLGQNLNVTGFTRITIKTFLEDMYLLQARLNLLIDDLQAAEPMEVADIITALQSIENENLVAKSPSVESWEDVMASTEERGGGRRTTPLHRHQDSHAAQRAARPLAKVRLPTSPVEYEPEGMVGKAAERHFEISAKSCFHVVFGDKSFMFPKLYADQQAWNISQGPWMLADEGRMKRQFRFKAKAVDILGRFKEADVLDEQTIDVFNDHVTYVVTHMRTAWHLPHAQAFRLVLKVVITHVAKSKCKLAVYTKVHWSGSAKIARNLVERQALDDAGRDAEELAEVATDEVRRLGAHSRTKRAIQVFGSIGQQTQEVLYTPEAKKEGAGGSTTSSSSSQGPQQLKPRTLTEMLLETVRSFMESVASSLVMWAFAALRKLFHAMTTHRLLLVVLVLSLATNAVFSSRETASWWTERHAAQYMRRLGVGPNTIMSRSVYVADLEEAARGLSGHPPHEPSVCYDTFRAMANSTDLDAPFEQAGALLSSASGRAAAQRLRRARQRLGTYRHDLLVAMRIINSVEREMVQSEWETWLADENGRCSQVKMLLLEAKRSHDNNSSSSSSNGNSNLSTSAKTHKLDLQQIATLAEWHRSYCGSCHTELVALEEAAWRQSMV